MSLSLDLTHNLRQLKSNAGFVGLCILVIALSIGLSITMYSTVSDFRFSKLPFPNSERFISIEPENLGTDGDQYNNTIDAYTFQQLSQNARSFETLGTYRVNNVTFSDGDISQRFFAGFITPNLLDITAVQPILGRSLSERDDKIGADSVVLISHSLWRNYYAGDPDIIGKTSRIDGNPHTIIGVMPEKFNYPLINELWIPLQLPNNVEPGGKFAFSLLDGVLSENTSIADANREVGALLQKQAQDYPEFYGNKGARVKSRADGYSPNAAFIYPLIALTLTLLALSCLNVSNLLVSRTQERLQELAIRNALGASPIRLAKTVLLDSLIICFLGAVLGLILADLGMAFIRSTINSMSALPLPLWLVFDWEIDTVIAAFLVVTLIWLASSTMTVKRVTSRDINTLLAGAGKGVKGFGQTKGSAIVVSVEVILSCFILVLSGVSVGAAYQLTKTDYGTETQGLITGGVSLPNSSYTSTSSRQSYRQDLSNYLLQQNEFSQVAYTSALPSIEGSPTNFNLEDRDLRDNQAFPDLGTISISDNYFDVMDVQILDGRMFSEMDTESSQAVVIVDNLFAEKMWPKESPIGKNILINPETDNQERLRVVGVSSHIIQRLGMEGTNVSSFYRPLSQSSRSSFSIVATLTDSSQGSFSTQQRRLQEAGAKVDRDIPINNVQQLDGVITQANSFMELIKNISAQFAFITLMLAITGIYAIVSRSVRQRRNEIGVRRALGSNNLKVFGVFIHQAFRYLIVGLVIGGGAAIIATKAMSQAFTGIDSWLPIVLVLVMSGMGLLVFFASYIPAKDIIRLEPGSALRVE